MGRAGAVLVAALGAALALAAPAAPGGRGLDGALVSAMNDARTRAGLATVRSSPSLRAAAAAHTREMVRFGYFGHESRAGSLAQRLPRSYRRVGEILFEGTPPVDAAAVVRSWLASPKHRTILLGAGWHDVGVSAQTVSTGAGAEVVVTVDFGSRA